MSEVWENIKTRFNTNAIGSINVDFTKMEDLSI